MKVASDSGIKMITNDIKAKTETFVTSKCPRGLDHPVYKLNYNTCKICDLLISDLQCGYEEYIPEKVNHSVDEDEDDGSGGLPCNTYMWRIPCDRCGNELLFTSGFSCMQKGDRVKCKKCGLTHYYLKWENKKDVFMVPIK